MVDYRVELASASDVESLAEVEQAAATLFPERLLPLHLRGETIAREKLLAAQAAGMLWVAKDGAHTVLGFACVAMHGAVASLSELDVLPAYGGQGIGSALLASIIAWGKSRGIPTLYLTTFQEFAPSQALYRKFGFVTLGAVPDFLAAALRQEVAAGLADRIAMRLTFCCNKRGKPCQLRD
ncbi:putative acetyltransferase [Collimonas arenae]|uniref:Putative acetyltransferase n=1 Tax=Collimonas arenae TaxID=279058 RepID=A0A0A1F8L1_9BURK|nr:GNAT family N-acetyltransferase [Collimonas arenae]AIY41073.1 putative acetyltransferase [Collimonas arenae]